MCMVHASNRRRARVTVFYPCRVHTFNTDGVRNYNTTVAMYSPSSDRDDVKKQSRVVGKAPLITETWRSGRPSADAPWTSSPP